MSKISVCIASYNGEQYIQDQLNSILSQLKPKDEIIISDDNSTDRTIEIIKSMGDNRIKLFEGAGFKNPIKNFEFAISKSSGDYIFLSDQDDVWKDNKIEEVIRYFHEGYNLVMTDCIVVDQSLNPIINSYFLENNSGAGFLKNLIKNSFIGCCMAFESKLKDYILPFPENIPMHDVWIGLMATLKGKVKFLDKPLILYRRHGSNFSPTSKKSKFNTYTKVLFRVQIIKAIISRFYGKSIKKRFKS